MTAGRLLLGRTLIGAVDDVIGPGNGMRGQVIGNVVAAVLEGGCFALLVPVLRALFDGRPADVVPWTIALCACAAGSGVATRVVSRRARAVGIEKLTGTAMRQVGEHAVRLPLGWFGKQNVGRLTSLVTESTTILMTLPGMITSQVVSAVMTPVTVVVVVAFIDWRMALAMVVFVPLGVLAYRRLSKVAKGEFQQMGDSDEAVSARVVEYGQAQMVLRSAGLTERTWDRLDETLSANRDSVIGLLDATDRPMVRFKAVVQAGFAAVVGVATLLGTTGAANPADLIAILFLAVRFMQPLTGLGGMGAEGLSRGLTDLRRIQEFRATPVLTEPETLAVPASTDVATREVSFGYHAQPVLDDVTIELPAGSMTAIVGPSGAGKTTLTRLVARFWDPGTGAVLLGGLDLRDIGSHSLMERLAIVSQDVYLFDDTILANVRLGRPGATDTEVYAAGRAARLDEVVARLPDGWDSRVGEGGNLLSGGERQRVSIARALLKDAPVILLDEMTSALDAENERAITQAIREMIRDRTVLVIAHRLSTIRDADQIVYLENGRVAEAGPPDSLIEAGGRFSELWASRASAENWQITRPPAPPTESTQR